MFRNAHSQMSRFPHKFSAALFKRYLNFLGSQINFPNKTELSKTRIENINMNTNKLSRYNIARQNKR